MLNHALDVGSTALRVGYESVSQFNREYSRLFGALPQHDIRRMRELSAGGVVQSVTS
jgi:AraC-like DNA-binding protein